MKKKIYIVVGLFAFAVGTVGVILPILPTTPFLLLASLCFMRGSEKVNQWFIGTKLYKKHLESFVNDKTMTKKQKIFIPTIVTIMIAIPFVLVDNMLMRITLLLIVLTKWYYFTFKIETKESDPVKINMNMN